MILKPKTVKLKSKRRLMRAYLNDKNRAIYEETAFVLMDPRTIRDFMIEGDVYHIYDTFFDTLARNARYTNDGMLCPLCLAIKRRSNNCLTCWQLTSCGDTYICSHPNSRWDTVVHVFMRMSEYYNYQALVRLLIWNNHLEDRRDIR